MLVSKIAIFANSKFTYVKENIVMKASFTDFITENPVYSKFESDSAAQGIFELLSRDESIIAMVDAAEQGRPALTPCAAAVEEYGDSMPNTLFNIRNGFERTAVGCMVKTILAPFGYRPTENKRLSTGTPCQYFKSAPCYALTGPASMRIVKTIEEL